jgi:hypothetical protein
MSAKSWRNGRLIAPKWTTRISAICVTSPTRWKWTYTPSKPG